MYSRDLIHCRLNVLCSILDGSYQLTRCVEPGGQSISLNCPLYNMISIRSAHYARLPVNTPGFCEQPTPDGNRGECVPHADDDADRTSVATSCNTHQSCTFSPTYDDIVSSCSQVSGPVYVNVIFDCLPRESALNADLSSSICSVTLLGGRMAEFNVQLDT